MRVGFLGTNLHINETIIFLHTVLKNYFSLLIIRYKLYKSTTLWPLQISASGWQPCASKGDYMKFRSLKNECKSSQDVTIGVNNKKLFPRYYFKPTLLYFFKQLLVTSSRNSIYDKSCTKKILLFYYNGCYIHIFHLNLRFKNLVFLVIKIL